MKDVLLQDGERRIDCELDGLKLTFTRSDYPKAHYTLTLRDDFAYEALKRRLVYLCDRYGFEEAGILLDSDERDEFFTNDMGRVTFDPRDPDEIYKYMDEAQDKVWYMRSRPCDNPKIEDKRLASIRRIRHAYRDIPRGGYTDWECGYWNGILGALRWVMGEEKNSLYT